MSEFGRICERKKFRVNVSKSKVMRCSRYEIGAVRGKLFYVTGVASDSGWGL